MSRKPRDITPGTEYHLISRFVDREWFIENTYEREHYLRLLGRALAGTDWRLSGYAVMSNHIHLKSIAGHQPLDRWIRMVHSPFADALNRSRNRIGNVFVRGPKAYRVTPESNANLLAYIHNNPVRAGLCADAAGSNWTSHRAYVGDDPVPPWLHVEEGLRRAGFADRRAFDAWVNDPARAETEYQFTEEHYAQMSTEYGAAAEARRLDTVKETADRIAQATASAVGITVAQLCSTSRGQLEVLARAVAVRSGRMLGLSGQVIAGALNMSPSRVSVLRNGATAANVEMLAEHVTGEVAASVSEAV
jgi:hypothetical protein